MEPIQRAFIRRAQDALALAGSEGSEKAARFIELARCMALAGPGELPHVLAKHHDEGIRGLCERGAVGLGEWSPEAAALAQAFIASVAESSVLDGITRYATELPTGASKALIASGFSANVATEGDPKVVKRPGLDLGDVEPTKAAAIVVLTKELARFGGQFKAILERELAASITRATNAAVLAMLVDTGTTDVAGSGDPLDDLRAGLRAAGPSEGYVVAAPSGDVAWLATHPANRGAGIRGGEFVPGVHLVAIDDATHTTIIPASRLALLDWGLSIAGAEHASVNMAASPTSPSNVVNLWQTGAVGLLAERRFHLAGDTSGVVTVTTGS